jgi:hypothetical protein
MLIFPIRTKNLKGHARLGIYNSVVEGLPNMHEVLGMEAAVNLIWDTSYSPSSTNHRYRHRYQFLQLTESILQKDTNCNYYFKI